jgi:thiamine pyrophosphokinase
VYRVAVEAQRKFLKLNGRSGPFVGADKARHQFYQQQIDSQRRFIGDVDSSRTTIRPSRSKVSASNDGWMIASERLTHRRRTSTIRSCAPG